MKAKRIKTALACLVLAAATGASTLAGFAENRDSGMVERLWAKPIVRQAAIGAAIGTGGGLLSDRMSVGRGALAGGVAGAGMGAISQSRYFQDKPLMRNAAQGAVMGTGVGYATRAGGMKGALVGAGAGAGYHYVRKYLDDR